MMLLELVPIQNLIGYVKKNKELNFEQELQAYNKVSALRADM